MDQPESYLDKLKKAKERASQAATPVAPQMAPQVQPSAEARPIEPQRSQADLLREKRMKAEAVNKFMDEMRAQEAAKTKPVTDYSKAAGSGAQEFALSVPGMFGDVPKGVVSAVTALPTYGVPYVAEKFGVPFSEERKKGLEAGREAVLGTVAKFTPPTTEQYSQMAEPYAEEAFGVGPLYQPKTPQEAMTKQGISLGLQSAMGKPQGIFKRMLSGSAAGAGSEGLGQALESTDYASLAPYARLGALTTLPYALEKFPVGQIGRIAEGTLPSLAARRDIAAGVGDFGKKSKLVTHQMARGENVGQVAAKMPDRIRNFNQEITGIGSDTAEHRALLERVGKTERTRVFDLARSNPNSDSIDISGMGDLQNHPIFQEAELAARKNAINDPFNATVMPETIPGKPAQTLHSPTLGLYTNPATPPQQINGNLSFYQGMKEELDGIIKRANSAQDWRTAQKAQEIKNRLIDEIDYQVPEYRPALNESRLTFEMVEAPEAGYNFSTKYKALTDYDFKKSFNNYTDDQRNAFRVGFLNRLEESLINGEQGAFNLFIKNPAFQKKVEYVFGPKIAGEIRAKYLSESMLQKAAQLDANMASNAAVSKFEKLYQKSIPAAAAIGAGAATEAVQSQFLAQMLSQLNLSPVTVAATIAAFGTTVAGRGLLKGAEQRIANKMVQLVAEGNAASYAKLNKLIDKHPEVYPKIMTLLETARTSTELYGQPREEKPAALPPETLDQTYDRLVKEGKIQPVRANGGRVGRADGGRISVEQGVRALMRAVEDAKKSVTKSTENLLQLPDEHVAQTLDAAKRHI